MSMHPKKSAFLLKTHLLWIDPCPELKGPTLCLVSFLVTSHQTTTTAPETTETPNASDVHFAHLPNVLDPTPPVAPKKSIHPPKNQELQTNAGKKNSGSFFHLNRKKKNNLPNPRFPPCHPRAAKKKKKHGQHTALLRRETVARCELDGFAHGQVAGSLLQGHVFEMPLVSWTVGRLRELLAEKIQVNKGFAFGWKKISTKNKCDLKMDVWRWCFTKKVFFQNDVITQSSLILNISNCGISCQGSV